MPSLNLLLQSVPSSEKIDIIYDVFESVSKEVNQILLFGPCNNTRAEEAAEAYYYQSQRNQNNFFSFKFEKDELKALPAVIAKKLHFDTERKDGVLYSYDQDSKYDFEQILRDGYLYETGTCETFAILGAYILAKKYDVELSIESIYSHSVHTYIRLHTQPEYIFDFWSMFACDYTDNMTWNEAVLEDYKRTQDTEYRTEITLTSEQLLKMGERVFTEQNSLLRMEILHKVDNLVNLLKENSLNVLTNSSSVMRV